MDKATLRQKLSYYTLFVPVRFYLLLFVAALALASWWTSNQKTADETAFSVVLTLLVKVAAVFIVSVLVLSFLSVIIPFVAFWWQKKRGHVQVRVQNTHRKNRNTMLQRMEMSVNPVWQPPFGFLKFRFLYDENQLSPKFSMVFSKQQKLLQGAKSGWYNWPLPTIREYDVHKLVVYFEDIFQFFSFSTSVPVNQSFFTKPLTIRTPEEQLNPKKTENEQIRIEELRRVEGEYLNYKNFEDNDDVRRIVWKIYAKNKELVVRTQEIFDPVASHTYLYCTFHDSIGVGDSAMMGARGLNYFKNTCWSVFEQLKKQGAEVRYVPDQEIPAKHFDTPELQVEYAIAVARWQQSKPMADYVKAQDASVVCISSLTDINALETLIEQTGTSTTFVFVKLTNSLRRSWMTNWVRWLFLQEEKDKDKMGLMRWRVSSLKNKVRKNEKNIEELLKKTDAKTIFI
jgi:hypothetical protein